MAKQALSRLKIYLQTADALAPLILFDLEWAGPGFKFLKKNLQILPIDIKIGKLIV